MIPGAILKFNDAEYTVPFINLRIAYAYKDQIATLCKPEGEVSLMEYVEAAGAILFELIKRNYPAMTRDEFDDMIDIPILRPIMNGMLHASGVAGRPLAQAAES